jgi:hypothetical protein
MTPYTRLSSTNCDAVIEGQNLMVEYRVDGQHVDLIPQYAAELVRARVDVIVAGSTDAVRAVQQATKTIPIASQRWSIGHRLGLPSGEALALRWARRRYARVGLREIVVAARRQYDGRQYPRG